MFSVTQALQGKWLCSELQRVLHAFSDTVALAYLSIYLSICVSVSAFIIT